MFETTAWTLFEQAAGKTDRPEAISARTEICQRYYESCRSFFEMRLTDKSRCDDYNQEFWSSLFQNWEPFKQVQREKGRFRSFLAQRMEWFVRKPPKSLKRTPGGSIDSEYFSEEDFLKDSRQYRPPVEAEVAYSEKCNRQLLRNALHNAREILKRDGKTHCVEAFDLKEKGNTHDEIGSALKLTEDQVRQALKCIKECFRRCMLEEVAFDLGVAPTSPEAIAEAKMILSSRRSDPES